MAVLRIIAFLIGLVCVIGGGVCAVVGIPSFLLSLFSGSGASSILLATLIGVGILAVGWRMLTYALRGSKSTDDSDQP